VSLLARLFWESHIYTSKASLALSLTVSEYASSSSQTTVTLRDSISVTFDPIVNGRDTLKPRYSKNGEESYLIPICPDTSWYAYQRSIGQLIFIFLKKNYWYVSDTANLYSDMANLYFDTDTSVLHISF